jgi:rhodanese-related sulfurtransferase|mmetsp:Transcript_13774/g.29740  ORF Transcript_13774/g.29740 Transcript_13774/m.29740 type:complete len:205 (-) Transcript_13774:782-1396(-)
MLTHRSAPHLAIIALTLRNRPLTTAAFCNSPACLNHPYSDALKHSSSHTAMYISPNVMARPTFHRTLTSKSSLNMDIMNLFGFGATEGVPKIDRNAMRDLIDEVTNNNRKCTIIDVRGPEEVASTGKLGDVVQNLPLPDIAGGAFSLDKDIFKSKFGFEKPGFDSTIVFSCKGGIRSAKAVKLAKEAGYTDILDYSGGANDWFA